ncbi:MAG: DUF1801 domain-containing protein [Brucellaceae bacterium]|nr:DUF1801 domain-containing protein [Brucellaceae bacterium]
MNLAARLRALIAETARETDGVGEIAESVKWGEPSFAPARPRIGSSVRLQERANGDVALMFICHTGLVERFRDLYGDTLTLEGNRAIVLSPDEALPVDALKHCIAMALTYHLGKRGDQWGIAISPLVADFPYHLGGLEAAPSATRIGSS